MPEACTSIHQRGWLALREQLWPDHPRAGHLAEMASFLRSPQRYAQFVEYEASGTPVGLVEVSLRSDYVNGTDGSPVAFVEAVFVAPHARRQGIARKLIAQAERWGQAHGCRELASDAALDNTGSHAMHAALGFSESERVVFFRKRLPPQA